MTESQAIEAMLQRWKDGWEANHPAGPQFVPFTFTDEDFTPDELGALGAWAGVSIHHTTRRQITQGRAPYRKYECQGHIFVQLFGPQNQGTKLLTDLVGDVRTALEGLEIVVGVDRVITWEGRTVDDLNDPAWATRAVVIRFRYTETR